MRILILLSRFPYPLEKGDKLRAYHQIKELSKSHKIILCCLSFNPVKEKHIKELAPFCEHIEIIKLNPITRYWNILKTLFFDKKPLQVSYFYQKKAQTQLDGIIEKHMPKHIYCQLIRTSEYLLKYQLFDKTIDYMDALSVGIERRVAKTLFFLKPLFKEEARRLKNYETHVYNLFKHRTIISNQDKELLSTENAIEIIKNGVNTEFFTPKLTEKKYDLLFTGNMSYPPNVDCVEYIVTEILPIIENKGHELKFLISGANPSTRVKKLASKNVIITGWVDDIRDSYNSAKVFIAPLRIGTGLQNKLLEAMAMKLPCITSTLANNALKATPNKEIFIADTKEEVANQIIQLIETEELAESLSRNGQLFVQENYSWQSKCAQLNELFEKN